MLETRLKCKPKIALDPNFQVPNVVMGQHLGEKEGGKIIFLRGRFSSLGTKLTNVNVDYGIQTLGNEDKRIRINQNLLKLYQQENKEKTIVVFKFQFYIGYRCNNFNMQETRGFGCKNACFSPIFV